MPKPNTPRYTDISWEHGDGPNLKELREALEPFGIIVTKDPGCTVEDSHGFIFSKEPLTKEEIAELTDRC